MTDKPTPTIAIVGLGYVGLPLAVEFGKKFRTIGYDLSEEKVAAYRRHADTAELRAATGFAPATPVKEGVRRFVEWYRAYYKP